MVTHHTVSLENILKQYLNHIVYIDDEFKISWPMQETEKAGRPRRSGNRMIVSEEKQDETSAEPSSGDNLEAFCNLVRKQYPEILLTPIIYQEEMDIENLLLHMKNARMLVLDWSLSEKFTAVNLLNAAEFAGQLRFCVIYTSRLADAEKEFVEKIADVRDAGLKRGKYEGKDFDYIRINSVIYMICEKDKFNFHMIMGALVDIFIEEIGYFPIAFIDMIGRLEEKVPYYLNEFSYPFDKLLLLQTNSDGLPLNDVYNMVSDMVVNNIRADISLNEDVLNGIYEKQIAAIGEILNDDQLFHERLTKTLNVIFSRLQCGEEDKKAFENISVKEYKNIIEKAVKEPENLSKGIHNASDKLIKLYAKKRVEITIKESNPDCGDIKQIKSELTGLYKERIRDKIEKLFPSCLMILTNPDENYNMNKLITSLKIINYKEDERLFSEIFRDCYDRVDEDMCLKMDGVSPRLGLLQNKFHAGDIFYKRPDTEGKMGKFYLCIVPSCHLLRPKKVEGNILFVEGKIVNERPNRNLKDSEHFMILPGVDDENRLVRIVWQYHRIVPLDLRKISCDNFEKMCRPYRLAYEYMRQIMGEFVAFYSKSGVEELFLKADSSLEHLLLQK